MGLFELSFSYLSHVSDLVNNTLYFQYPCSFKRLTKCCLNIFSFKFTSDSVCNNCMIKVVVSILSSWGKRSALARLIHYWWIGLFQFSNNFFAITSDKWCVLCWEDALEAFIQIANLMLVLDGATCLANSFEFTIYHCMRLKAFRHEWARLNRIAAS